MCVLVATSNVDNSEGNKECCEKGLFCNLRTCRDMVLIYIWGIYETRGAQGFVTLRGQLLGNGPRVYNKYENKIICWSEHPVLR